MKSKYILEKINTGDEAALNQLLKQPWVDLNGVTVIGASTERLGCELIARLKSVGVIVKVNYFSPVKAHENSPPNFYHF